MVQRFQEQQQIQKVQTSTGAAQGLLSLADRLNQFERIGQQLTAAGIGKIQEEQAARGAKSGMEAGTKLKKTGSVVQTPEYKEAGFFNKAEVTAYNEALKASYYSQLSNDISENISRIEAESGNDLIKFNESVNGFAKGLLESVDDVAKPAAFLALDEKSSGARIRVQKQAIESQKAEAKNILVTNAQNSLDESLRYIAIGDPTEAASAFSEHLENIQGLENANFINADTAAKLRRESNRKLTEANYMKTIFDASEKSISSAYGKIEELSKKVPKGFAPEEWDSFLVGAQQKINQKKSRLKAQLDEMSDAHKLQLSIARGSEIVNTSALADPTKGSQDRKDVSAYYDDISKNQWKDNSPAEIFSNTVKFVKSAGIFPDKLQTDISSVMRAGNPEQMATYSKIIKALTDDPFTSNVVKDIPVESRSMAMQINELTSLNMDLETATEIARKNTFGVSSANKERIKIETQNIRKELPKMLEDKFNKYYDPSVIPFMGEEPEISTAYQSEYNILFENYMLQTDGNAELSANAAFDTLRGRWDRNSMGSDGVRIMKDAPEIYYSVPGVNNAWMKDQFNNNMKDLDINPDKVTITPVPDTIKSGKPQYYIMEKDESGRISPRYKLGKDGAIQPMKWFPAFEETEEYKESKADEAERLAEESREMEKANEIKVEINRIAQMVGSENVTPDIRMIAEKTVTARKYVSKPPKKEAK